MANLAVWCYDGRGRVLRSGVVVAGVEGKKLPPFVAFPETRMKAPGFTQCTSRVVCVCGKEKRLAGCSRWAHFRCLIKDSVSALVPSAFQVETYKM